MSGACFQTGCTSTPRYLYSLGGGVLVLCEAHGQEYELGLEASAVPVCTLACLGADVSAGNVFPSCFIKVVGARSDQTDLALTNLGFRLEQLKGRDSALCSVLVVFMTCLAEEPLINQERLGCIELVTALVRGLGRRDAGAHAISLALCDAVASTVQPNKKLRRVWRLVGIALREGPTRRG